mgnify:FL=1
MKSGYKWTANHLKFFSEVVQTKGEGTIMMKKTVSLLMAATLAVGMLAGCGGQKSAETSASAAGASEPAAVEEPEKNESTNYKKEIRIGTLADLTVKNRYAGTATVTTQTCNSTFNGLVSVGRNNY